MYTVEIKAALKMYDLHFWYVLQNVLSIHLNGMTCSPTVCLEE